MMDKKPREADMNMLVKIYDTDSHGATHEPNPAQLISPSGKPWSSLECDVNAAGFLG